MTNVGARILILTYTPLAREPRALKQIRYLQEANDVTTAGFGEAPFSDVAHVEIPDAPTQRWGILGRLVGLGLLLLHWYRPLARINQLDRFTLASLGNGNWDIVVAHDLKTLDAALALAPTSGVILDLHEYAPRQAEHSFIWRLLIAPYFRWMCRVTVPKTAAVVTVSQGIVDEYKRQFGFDSTLVINATPYYEIETGAVGSPLRLVHSGGIAVQRRLDIMIQGVRDSSANVTLDLFLMGGDTPLMAQLKAVASGDPRIRFREPVAYDDLVRTLSGFDLGLSIFPPTTFNLAWCLPNKFFDFVQARLGVIVGPSPEMSRLVGEYGIGLILPDFEPASLTAALDSLNVEQVAEWKAASAASADGLSSESQASVWSELISRVLAGR